MCILNTASWSSLLTHHNISQSWFILPKLVQNVLKVGSFSKSWFKMCPKLVHFPKVGSFSKSWYEMCQNQVNNYISNSFITVTGLSWHFLLPIVPYIPQFLPMPPYCLVFSPTSFCKLRSPGELSPFAAVFGL